MFFHSPDIFLSFPCFRVLFTSATLSTSSRASENFENRGLGDKYIPRRRRHARVNFTADFYWQLKRDARSYATHK